jgi:hypothetical protein
MWWFKWTGKKGAVPTGTEKLVEMITDQCCAWFEIPIVTPPKVVVFADKKKPEATYDSKTDTVSVYGEENATVAILAHEVAHAVVCRCEGKLSPRMHEILAGYAEFKVRKAFPEI